MDSAGTILWQKRYGGNRLDWPKDIVKTDYGFIICGSTSSDQNADISQPRKASSGGDFWVLHLDTAGNKIWDKRYGGNSNNVATCIRPALGGGYWVSGETDSDDTIDVSEPAYGRTDYWIIRIDDWGNKIWDKRFGSAEKEYNTTFIELMDSSIIICGEARSGGSSAIRTDTGKGDYDYWAIRFKYGAVPVSVSEMNMLETSISLYPNPASWLFTISSNQYTINSIELYNVLGEKVQEKDNLNTREIKLDVTALPLGIYFVKVFTEKGVVTKKLLTQ
jgi:hypothetical protein